jgi:hypothetical protein
MGLDSTKLYATSGLNLPAYYNAFNHTRNETTDEFTGQYGITENWIISSGNYEEDFTVSTKASIDTGLTQVSIDGQVVGLETNVANDVSTTKWGAANAGWTTVSGLLYSRASLYAGVSNINSQPLSSQIGKNPIVGNIKYTYDYDTRPTNYITGALTELININDENPSDIFASIPIIGRANGPILQDMNTTTERRRDLSIELQMPVTITTTTVDGMLAASPKASVDALVASFKANLQSSYNQVYINKDSEGWSPKTGRYTRGVGWTYQNC